MVFSVFHHASAFCQYLSTEWTRTRPIKTLIEVILKTRTLARPQRTDCTRCACGFRRSVAQMCCTFARTNWIVVKNNNFQLKSIEWGRNDKPLLLDFAASKIYKLRFRYVRYSSSYAAIQFVLVLELALIWRQKSEERPADGDFSVSCKVRVNYFLFFFSSKN